VPSTSTKVSSVQTGSFRTECDYHADSPVLGKHVLIVATEGKTINVHPFTDSLGSLQKVPIVDAAVAYDCPYSGKTYCLIIHNALFVDAMDNNLIPPFLMQEAGVVVSGVPKIHSPDPSIDDHMLMFPQDNLRIHMSLRGIISYFPTRKP